MIRVHVCPDLLHIPRMYARTIVEQIMPGFRGRGNGHKARRLGRALAPPSQSHLCLSATRVILTVISWAMLQNIA